MEAIRNAALAYHATMSDEQKQYMDTFFTDMDKKGDGKITFPNYQNTLIRLKVSKGGMSNGVLFRELDKDQDRRLDKNDIITLSYIISSGLMVFCRSCGSFLSSSYFSCSTCFNPKRGRRFDVCSTCYHNTTYSHDEDHTKFESRDIKLISEDTKHTKMGMEILGGVVAAGGTVGVIAIKEYARDGLKLAKLRHKLKSKLFGSDNQEVSDDDVPSDGASTDFSDLPSDDGSVSDGLLSIFSSLFS